MKAIAGISVVVVLVGGCDLVVGIEDVVLATGGAGSASAGTTGATGPSGSTGPGGAWAPCESQPGDAFDDFSASRWTVDAGEADARNGELVLRLDPAGERAAVASRVDFAGLATCAVWVTSTDGPDGVEQGIAVTLDDGHVVELVRRGDTLADEHGQHASLTNDQVIVRLRFTAEPPRVVREYRTPGDAGFEVLSSTETSRGPVAPVRLFARRTSGEGSLTVHLDDFNR